MHIHVLHDAAADNDNTVCLYCRERIGIVPIDLAITKKLIVWLNEENKVLKEEGFTVDGKHYKANFKGCISDWIMLYIKNYF